MEVNYDPDFIKFAEAMKAARLQTPKPPRHEINARRTLYDTMLGGMMNAIPLPPDVEINMFQTDAKDGFAVPIYHYRKHDAATQTSVPAIVYIHGGGYIALSVALHNNHIASLAATSGVQIFAVDYRLAPEHPHPTPVEDCFAGLEWVRQHATEFNIDLNRIAVYGESAGGGLAASLAILARDRHVSPPLAKQFLVYPMLDDRNLNGSKFEQALVWNTEDNVTGWTAYVGENAGKEGISPYAAAARVESVEGLPPLFIDLGGLDLFRDEDISYAARFAAANIDVEIHVYPGVPHAFDLIARGTNLVNRVVANRISAMTSF